MGDLGGNLFGRKMPFACPALKPPAAASGSGSGHNGETSAAAVSAAVGEKRSAYFSFLVRIVMAISCFSLGFRRTKASPWFEGSTQTKFLYCPLLISARSLSGFQTTVVFELLFSIDMTRLNALSSISTVPLWFVNAESNSPRIVRSPFSV